MWEINRGAELSCKSHPENRIFPGLRVKEGNNQKYRPPLVLWRAIRTGGELLASEGAWNPVVRSGFFTGQ